MRQNMASVAVYVLGFFMCFQSLSLAQEPVKIDSSYQNWYYESREKLYNALNTVEYDVVFLGNSITERGDWQELIGSRYSVGNRGIGGDNTFGVLARLDGIIRIQPKKLFLMIGINDIGRGLPTAVILENYRKIVHRIQVESPKTEIILHGVLPLNEAVLPYDYLKGKADKIRQVNAGIRAIAADHQLSLIDLRPILADGDVLKKSVTQDGIHLKPQAYLQWVAFLKAEGYL